MTEVNVLSEELDKEAEKLQPWWFSFEINGKEFGGSCPRDTYKTQLFFEWIKKLGGSVQTILEFGSHEGSHSLQLASYPGVKKVIGLEGREDNLARANFVKRVYSIDSVEFHYSNLEHFCPDDWPIYDAVFCAGVLYHLPRPWELIEKIAVVCRRYLFLDTHYAMTEEVLVDRYAGAYFDEGPDPLSGLSPVSFWLSFKDLSLLLMKNGFLIRFVHDIEGFPKGPRAFIFAEKDDHGLVGCEWSKAQHDLMNINRNKKQLFPISVRKKIADLIGINRIHSRTDHLETHVNNQIGRLDNRVSELTDKMESFVTDVYTKIHSIQSIYKALESDERLWNISRKRWRNVAPNEGLTWGFQISGKAFIDKVKAYKAFDSSKTILELGPGYGRILTSILESGIEFKKYIGLDISPKNIEYLKNKFVSENIIFINADAEKYDLQMSYDIFLSSLVMKHLYPTFELALKNIAQYANKGCKFFFDLIEGDRQIFEHDKVTYIRYYTKPEVEQILNRLNLKIVSFDAVEHVEHDEQYARLLVVAGKD